MIRSFHVTADKDRNLKRGYLWGCTFAGLLVHASWAQAAPPQPAARASRTVAEKTVPSQSRPSAAPASVTQPSKTDTLNKPNAQKAMIDQMLKEREALLLARRKEAIRLLEQFIKEEPEHSEEMPDALLRLAELRWEQSKADYLATFGRWQSARDTASEGSALRRLPPPEPDYRAAMQIYDRILENHRDFSRYDLALFMKAYALVEAGDTHAAIPYYRRILAEYPKSKFVPDAHMAVAEASFTGNFDYASALSEYEQVLRYPGTELYDLALFKSAWCLWRLGRSKEAATRFRRVLDLGGAIAKTSESKRKRLRELQEEALEYLIQVFTEDESNTAADIRGFLAEIGGEKYAKQVLARLAETFYNQARFERAVQAYELLRELDPDSQEVPRYQAQIAEGYEQLGDYKHMVVALESLATTVAPNSLWCKKQLDQKGVVDARKLTEKLIRTLAKKAHQIGQKDKDRAQLELAANLYRLYLRFFPKAPGAYDTNFYLAEILFHRLGRFSEAGDAYLATATLNPKGPYTKDALYNAIAAYERVRETELAQCTQKPSAPSEPRTCRETQNDQKFSAAIEKYIELFPNDPDIPDVLFRQGKLYYDRGIYDPAVRLFGQLIEKYPKSTYAKASGEYILDSFNRAQDYGNIDTWARRLKKSPAFAAPEAQARLNGLIVQATFKVGEQLAAHGEHEKAALAYHRAAAEFPREERAKQAYYNSALEWQKAGKLSEATTEYDALIDKYPRSIEGAKGAWAAAQMYESIALFSDAAKYYALYSKRFPDADKQADALYNAAVLEETAGNHGQAISYARQFQTRFPKDSAADDVSFLLAKAQEQKGQWADAAKTYRAYITKTKKPDRKVEAQVHLAMVLAKAHDRSGERDALSAAVAAGKARRVHLKDGRYFVAQARYLQGDAALSEFDNVTIAGDNATLRKRLEKKSELLKQAAQIYGDVVQYNVAEWSTAALFKIGRSYELYAEGLRDAPAPKGLNAEEEQSYRDQLSMFIVPIEEKALQAYAGGYKKALELRIYNSWTQKLREGLTRLNDVEYPPVRETGGAIVEASAIEPPLLLESLDREAPKVAEKGGKSR